MRQLGDGGWLQHAINKDDGAIDTRAICLIRETLARHNGLADFAFAMQGLGSGAISLFGSASNKARYLPRVARGEAIAAFGPDSAITKACQAIYTKAKAVIVAIGVPKLEDAALQTSAIIGGVLASGKRTGLQALLDGKSLFNAQPRLLIAPGHTATQAVATALDGLAQKLRAIGIIDGPGTTDEAAMAYADNFGSRNLFMVDPGVQYWDTGVSQTVDAPGSAWAAGLFAWTDAEYGFWASPSNKEFVGITGTTRAVEYLDGDATCRARELIAALVAE